ncbi:hypothetical protein BH09PLA1_BH09PLA1_36620 [soil metagenome]
MQAAKYRLEDRTGWVGWISIIGYAALCGLVYLLH